VYTVTFYSFKGGVGRTLALANVGLELARTGRRVLIVDFDIEAPGIDTFEFLKSKECHIGIVEYASEYISTRIAPDARDFIYEVLGVGQRGGRMWIMPSGKCDDEYPRKLRSIDWQKLYDETDGFLMFEDLKAQWNTYFKPDYVLIDSRTGYTDISGICTRQLPDSVVIFFLPNEQNLVGIKTIVSRITQGETYRKSKSIKLQYVMSNVPDLDDELEILAGLQRRFQDELQYEKLAATIHHYDSLYLLKQSLFIAERPNSRLAKEYRELMNSITKENFEDRESVIQSLTQKPSYKILAQSGEKNQGVTVDDILKHHSHDGEVMYLLGIDLKRRGRIEQSQMLLKRSLELGYKSPEALLEQSEIKEQEKDLSGASNDVLKALEFDKLNEDELVRTIEILKRIAPKKLLQISETSAFKTIKFGVCLWIANELKTCKEGLEASIKLLSRYKDDSALSVIQASLVKSSMMLSFIGLSKYEESTKLFGNVRPAREDLDMPDCFNYAMAEWGKTGVPPKDMFERVVDIDSERAERNDANYHQCLALALCVVGKKQDALDRLEKAREQISEKPKPEFSCWRYMQVAPSEFEKDCQAIEKLINGEKISPIFLQYKNSNR